jgi:hypothetical protein
LQVSNAQPPWQLSVQVASHPPLHSKTQAARAGRGVVKANPNTASGGMISAPDFRSLRRLTFLPVPGFFFISAFPSFKAA